jgi:phytoene desaturase
VFQRTHPTSRNVNAQTVVPGTGLAYASRMADSPRLVIIGGGLAGLSAGCYARRSGFSTTIIEHNLALGGVCTAWQRGPYVIDGCIHWLTGGPFARAYDELGIVERVPLRTLTHFATYENARTGLNVPITRDLDALAQALIELAPADRAEVERLREASHTFVRLQPPFDAPELAGVRERLHSLWEARSTLGALVHFRATVGEWSRERLQSEDLRRFFCQLVPESAPALVLLMVLGYLEHGYLSRPVGGTAAFRDALEHAYRSAGGEVVMPATVDEVLVEAGRACGVRLADGTMLEADYVLSTSSAPETVLRLLGGRYDAEQTRQRLASWRLFDPIVLASFGVERPYADMPGMRIIDEITPVEVGGRRNDSLYLRICNDDPSFAPPGHSVVQAMLKTDYEWWATRGSRYNDEKDAVAEAILSAIEPHFPGLRSATRARDVATPLTYWSMARSWRGAYEGWLPTPEAMFSRPRKTLSGLDGFYMAGQWVEPGGGVPTAVLSGRQAIQLLCANSERPFVARSALKTASSA